MKFIIQFILPLLLELARFKEISFNYLQEEYVQKTNLSSGPLSFKDVQKKEVEFSLLKYSLHFVIFISLVSLLWCM